MVYVVYTIDGDTRGLKNTLMRAWNILPSYSIDDIMVVLKVRDITTIDITDDEGGTPTPMIQTYPNGRTFGESFRECFLIMKSYPDTSKAGIAAIDTELTNMELGNSTIQSIADTYSTAVEMYKVFAFDKLEDLIRFIFR